MPSLRLLAVVILCALIAGGAAFGAGRAARPKRANAAGTGTVLAPLPAVGPTAALPTLAPAGALPSMRVRHRTKTARGDTTPAVGSRSTSAAGPTATGLTPSTSATGPTSATGLHAPASSNGSTGSTGSSGTKTPKTTSSPSGSGDVSSGGNSLGG